MTIVDPARVGHGALVWIGTFTARACSEDVLPLAAVGAFVAGKMSGDTNLVRRLAGALGSVGRLPAETEAVLAWLGLAEPPSLPDPTPAPTVLEILDSGPDELPALVAAVESASGFGRFPLSHPAGLPTVLTGAGLACLASYDLEQGCRLLRAASYAGAGDSLGQRWAIEFLARQQRPDGAFGYIATGLRGDIDPSDPRLISAYFLPVTVACLWTTAELTIPGFRLLNPPTTRVAQLSS